MKPYFSLLAPIGCQTSIDGNPRSVVIARSFMDSGLGAIAKKVCKRLTNGVMVCIHPLIGYPARNAIFLVILLLVLGTQFQLGTIGKFEFENSDHELYGGLPYYFIIPILLWTNSAFFKNKWLISLSTLISSILTLVMFLTFFGQILTDSPKAIRRTTASGSQIITLYQKRLDSFNSCRYLVRQRRIIPGILRSEVKLIKETCRFDGRGNPFPPDLQ